MSSEMDRIEARAHDQLRLLRSASGDLDAVRVAVTSPDGEVSVELDGVCALTALSLTPAALRLDGAVLGRRIVDVCAVAAREVQQRRAEIMTRFHAEFAPVGSEPGPGASN